MPGANVRGGKRRVLVIEDALHGFLLVAARNQEEGLTRPRKNGKGARDPGSHVCIRRGLRDLDPVGRLVVLVVRLDGWKYAGGVTIAPEAKKGSVEGRVWRVEIGLERVRVRVRSLLRAPRLRNGVDVVGWDVDGVDEGSPGEPVVAGRIVVGHAPFVSPEKVDAFPRERTAVDTREELVQALRGATSGESESVRFPFGQDPPDVRDDALRCGTTQRFQVGEEVDGCAGRIGARSHRGRNRGAAEVEERRPRCRKKDEVNGAGRNDRGPDERSVNKQPSADLCNHRPAHRHALR